MQKIEQVPTNIITGALGAGKTTLIHALMAQKPQHERWAVLVNEFGEVGLDAALLAGSEDNGIFIREVPGGCMCCTSGLPMQIALNMLLAKAKPHRLLIEPTGLGHPQEVLQTLSAEHYKEVLDVRATLALIDTRKLTDQRWREHHTFQEQIQIADHIIVTKTDLYSEDLAPLLQEYLDAIGVSDTPISYAQHGLVDPNVLLGQSRYIPKSPQPSHAPPASVGFINMVMTPKTGSIKIKNSGEGYYSYGWICAPNICFDYQNVMNTLTSICVERLKAVLITEQGVVACNLSDGCLSLNMTGMTEAADSRLEFITQDKKLAEQTCQFLEAALGLESKINPSIF
jgi:G3E family GTPase